MRHRNSSRPEPAAASAIALDRSSSPIRAVFAASILIPILPHATISTPVSACA
jgi:hypothetical protein